MTRARGIAASFAGALLTASAFAQCPSISVKGPQGVTLPGEEITFRVEVSDAAMRLAYRWSISAGTLINGQDTPAITVKTDKSMGNTNMTATVEIDGLPSGCGKTAAANAPIARLEREPLDEWGNLSNDEIRSRLDNFFFDLSNNPTNTGLIILYVPGKERRDVKNRRLRLIVEHARWRKFDINRLWFSFQASPLPLEARTILYRFYPGAENEIPCDKCTIIKGSQIR